MISPMTRFLSLSLKNVGNVILQLQMMASLPLTYVALLGSLITDLSLIFSHYTIQGKEMISSGGTEKLFSFFFLFPIPEKYFLMCPLLWLYYVP